LSLVVAKFFIEVPAIAERLLMVYMATNNYFDEMRGRIRSCTCGLLSAVHCKRKMTQCMCASSLL